MKPARNFGRQWTAWRLRLALSVLALAILSIRALAAPGEAEQAKCGLCRAPSRVTQLLAKNTPVAASTSTDSKKQPAPAASGPANMVWIPGGEFTMGTDETRSYAPERPAHHVRVDGFWMDATEVTNAEFAKFVAGDRLCHDRGAKAGLGGDEEAIAAGHGTATGRCLCSRFAGFFPATGPGLVRRCPQLVALDSGRKLARAGRTGKQYQRARAISGRPGLVGRRRGLCEVGGQATADGSGMGVCRPRRPGRRNAMPGARNSRLMANGWPIFSKANSPIKTQRLMALRSRTRAQFPAE